MTEKSFRPLAIQAVSAALEPGGLHLRQAIVLERIARGAGTDYWYRVRGPDDVVEVAHRLHPGSKVSFYFDGRIQRRVLNDDTIAYIVNVILADREATVGFVSADGVGLDVQYVAGLGDLTDFIAARPEGTEVFVGAYPGRDNDGVNAVTFKLPDRDGELRSHPY